MLIYRVTECEKARKIPPELGQIYPSREFTTLKDLVAGATQDFVNLN